MLKEVKQLNTQKNQMGMFTWNEQGGKNFWSSTKVHSYKHHKVLCIYISMTSCQMVSGVQVDLERLNRSHSAGKSLSDKWNQPQNTDIIAVMS